MEKKKKSYRGLCLILYSGSKTLRKKRLFHVCHESGNANLTLETSILELKANRSRGKKVARRPASFTDAMKGKPTTAISHT